MCAEKKSYKILKVMLKDKKGNILEEYLFPYDKQPRPYIDLIVQFNLIHFIVFPPMN